MAIETRQNEFLSSLIQAKEKILAKPEWGAAEWLISALNILFDSSFEGVVLTDPEGRIMKVNPAFSIITGYSEKEALGANPRILKSDRHDSSFYKNFWKTLIKTGSWEGEIWNRRKTGEVYPEWLRVKAVRNREGEIAGYLSNFFDLSERKNMEEKLLRYAHFDGLTGLPNKDRFIGLVEKRLELKEKGDKLAFICLDVDRFKRVNEILGHLWGDRLLQQIACRLKTVVPGSDTLSRLGGDDFCFILPGEDHVGEILSGVKAVQALFAKPFKLAEEDVFLSATMGVAVFPDDGRDAGSLLRKGDIALNRAKGERPGSYLFFSPSLERRYSHRLKTESELHRALIKGELRVFLQPKVDFITGRPVGMEALARWMHPERGLIPPAEFIPVAEQTGLIRDLDMQMLERACRWNRETELELGYTVPVAVNLSPRSFFGADLVGHIRHTLEQTGLAPSALRIEITESAAMDDVKRSLKLFEKLRQIGLELDLDDFGTGYSSLSYLRHFPISTLKIDQSFIRELSGEDGGSLAIVQAIIALGHSLGMKVLAEGVESADHVRFLTQSGCDIAQGYYYGRPLPADEARLFLRQNPPVQI